MTRTRSPPGRREMNTILLEMVFGRINRYKKEIEELSYDDMDRRANKEKIQYYEGKIEELEWIIGELMK